MYMNPNGVWVFTEKERIAANKVNGTNACTNSCKGCDQKKKKK